MYEYLIGYVTQITPEFLVLEVQGVGYKLFVGNPYRYEIDKNKLVKIFVHEAVSETEISLYGLYDAEDKELFEKLILVKGIGPKSALAILANEDHSGLVNAINQDDVAYLKKFPKIGPKAAQQIILDLKGKMTLLSSSSTEPVVQPIANRNLADALDALSALGYSSKVIAKIKPELEDQESMTTDHYLSFGLKLLMKK
ncbi:Holliday junction branch migration protein RuvA [Pediococcus inopinatus]|uniref:Holliday junction branch migration complex subunit RuvA n=1 Tax=Pediococcus inopinatus TaxID=114090 RepID=A0ABZ0Q4P4_9LACO|nr:Holliday junction branch migration protein RuvA [Pediococcus inopinatus]AVL00254.1 Holliday junction branch migration protein RuvA [Pediococcus inopinatus]KRN60958.1 Holliday junction DNA helicase subunit RuvA [Pediococcus inopinatus]WPC17916.1 Holliday junction branch migration protein RuvA [Pediococcus inopinatus]WPC19372.1 Holliday junction branch migration protein RuvA [Pediococcus inopinatus]WPC21165.1 Holliday junction branch migration protein RuvA [Pediococcus inopinatus]